MAMLRRVARVGVVAVALAAGGVMGQERQAERVATPAATRAATRPAQVRSPEVHEDGRITFRLAAPKAEEVVVSTEWDYGRHKMSKGEDGVWSVTLGPVEPNIYTYAFIVDGVSVVDPRNPETKRSTPTGSLVEVGGVESPYALRNVPHGVVHVVRYHSKALDAERRMHVYTPPGYEEKQSETYPVLYLLHGSGDDDHHWSNLGRANLILDNLIAAGKARPMIVVMPHGHARANQQGNQGGAGGPGTAERGRNNSAFAEDLLKDVMPYVEKHYRTKNEPGSRAIAGLSMGGGQSLAVGLRNTDKFAYVASFSGAVPRGENLDSLVPDAKALNGQLKLFWIACGKGDFLFKANQDFVAELEKRGVKHTWNETEGLHHWPIWRVYLKELAPLLFR